jgi:hypothetical protein
VVGVGGMAQPMHVGVNKPLCDLEGLFVNIATRGSKENNHEGLGGKLPTLLIPVY